MRYCNTCGNLIPDRSRKCRHCGADVSKKNQPDQPSTKYFEKYVEPQDKPSLKHEHMKWAQNAELQFKKSIWYIFPFFIIPGIGFMYVGQWKRGSYFLITFILTVILDVVTKVMGIFAFIPITAIAYLTLMTWSIVGTVKQIKLVNQEIEAYNQERLRRLRVEGSDFSLAPGK